MDQIPVGYRISGPLPSLYMGQLEIGVGEESRELPERGAGFHAGVSNLTEELGR